MAIKKIKPGRAFGVIAFLHVTVSITMSQVIILIGVDTDILSLYKLSALSFGVFVTVWGAVFGSSAIKTAKLPKPPIVEDGE